MKVGLLPHKSAARAITTTWLRVCWANVNSHLGMRDCCAIWAGRLYVDTSAQLSKHLVFGAKKSAGCGVFVPLAALFPTWLNWSATNLNACGSFRAVIAARVGAIGESLAHSVKTGANIGSRP